ncbi:hypothetical protein K435DRAFT_711169 [Dendrothele bispora CBS 962.96]|uniref:Yippee domain-containing protein n=1 Tax=Dendrothele bispora (strain CBS 962.96) TaxID=1314807 RepID=A0A4S8LG53_DENBC|nr:hypothetical protein K435DRAFT_762426 [Dendrothele bispora CBS 962.96]THV06822.1 hypothetical protein K435DRAFT_711169 [Dendrothele bispora CBS 962.96]
MSVLSVNTSAAVGEPDFSKPPSTPRRLPSIPQERPISRPRPLPPIPRALACKKCKTPVTSVSLIFPLESIPLQSRAFRGFSNRVCLFTEIHNAQLWSPKVRLMASGAHTVQELSCAKCSCYLGFKILRAHDRSERWKEGHYLLELEKLAARSDIFCPRIPHRRHVSSDSEESSS